MAFEHKVKALPYEYNSLKGISEQVNKWHHDKHYAGYVAKRNEIEKKLETIDLTAANANFSEYGELKRRETFNAAGQYLHEIYYDIMGGNGREEGEIVKHIEKDFGSVDKWKADFIAAAKTSLGWTIFCWDPSDNRLHNFTGDSHNMGMGWGCVPLIPIDTFEHAYYFDYGPDRPAYINAFLDNINWKVINDRYKKFIPKI